MPGFFSPLAGGWTLAPGGIVTPPPGTRYAGYPLIGVRATRTQPAQVLLMPALGPFHQVSSAPGAVIELQVNPFPIRRVVSGLPFGCPTFYLFVDDSSGIVPFPDGDLVSGSISLGTAPAVTIAMAGQDRIARHPASWATLIETAITAAAGTPGTWTGFTAAVTAALAPPGEPPVVLLDHSGAPRTGGSVRLVAGGDDLTLSLTPADAGDLQRTLARSQPGRAHVFQGAASVTIEPLPAGDQQLARVEDGSRAADRITVGNTGGHVLVTNLADWFAPQFAGPALARYSRGNLVQPFGDGRAYLDDLFRELDRARNPAGGLHLTGWRMDPDADLRSIRADDPANLARTLAVAVTAIDAAGGAARLLPARFLNASPQALAALEWAEFAFVLLATGALLALRNWDPLHTDGGGASVALLGLVADAVLLGTVFDPNGGHIELNQAALALDALAQTDVSLATYPADVADNPRAASNAPILAPLFAITRHFGIYHQNSAIVRRGAAGYVGYCGSVELRRDRLDDARHLGLAPMHDVHARFEGPAVRDLAVTFEQRWASEKRSGPAFGAPAAADLGTPGANAVQVARTYIRTADPSTALPFAPGGDRTIHDTLLRAIVAAREFIYIEDQYFAPPIAAPDGLALPQPKYGNVLVDKVRNGAIKRLVVTVPGVTDQPFGDVARSGFISDLQSADEGRGIVRIGYPRRHYTLPDNDLRASSGRCLLTESVPAEGETVCLGPKTRLPSVPFWLAVEGELMYVNDVARPGLWPPPPADSARFLAVRGSATQLVRGGVAPVGTRQRQHFAGAAATVVDLTPIYVDAKLMIVDDVFLSLGSASLSRRSLFHDGELTTFTMPEALRAASDNPVRDLRVRLWAEMLNLPPALAAPLLADPVAAAALFDRSPLRGNRYTDITGFPERAVASASGESILSIILGRLGVLHVSIGWDELFDTVIDPTSTLEL